MFMPIIILGGILSGVFTATESAAIAVLYALILGIFYLKTVKFCDLPAIFLETAETTSSVMFIIATATTLAWILTVFENKVSRNKKILLRKRIILNRYRAYVNRLVRPVM